LVFLWFISIFFSSPTKKFLPSNPSFPTREIRFDSLHHQQAVVRNPDKMRSLLQAEGIPESDAIQVVEADILNPEQLQPHIAPTSAILCAVGAESLFSPSQSITRAVQSACDAAQKSDAEKFLLCSSWGCGDHLEPHDGFLYRFFIHWVIYHPLQDHQASERYLHSFQQGTYPSLRFACIRPPGLGDGPRTELPFASENDKYSLPIATHSINRADVARFFYDLLEDDNSPHWNHSVAIGVGS
jgi:hypothetical protein